MRELPTQIRSQKDQKNLNEDGDLVLDLIEAVEAEGETTVSISSVRDPSREIEIKDCQCNPPNPKPSPE